MAPLHSTSTELILPDVRKRKNLTEKFQHVLDRVWDSSRQRFLGRDPLSWVLLGSYYLVFYLALAAMFGILLAFFLYIVIDANYPELQGMDNLQKGNPGLSFRPMPDVESTLVRFVQGIPSTYKVHTDHIQAFLDQYENEKQTGENFIDCSTGKRSEQNIGKVCRFNLDELGKGCTWQQEYGFDEGTPCILLKLNKMFGWQPQTFVVNEMEEGVQSTEFRTGYIGITCEGETPADKENVGNITFHPNYGFPAHFYPFINQEGYRQPVVFARFENPKNGVVINVYCRAWAYNIYHHRYDRAGSIHFELLVD